MMMRNKILVSLIVLSLLPSLVFGALGIVDYYNEGDDFDGSIYQDRPLAQTFTASKIYQIKSIKLKLWRYSEVGNVEVYLKNTQNENPIGENLCSEIFDGNLLSTEPTWKEINIENCPSLEQGKQYAIVIFVPSAIYPQRVNWRYDGSSSTYVGGMRFYSLDNGASWSSQSAQDFMFETWEELPPSCDEEHLELCLTQGDCEGAGGYWYNEVCNASPPPYLVFPSNFLASLKTTAGELFNDLVVPLVLVVSLSISFWFIEKVIVVAQGNLRESKKDK